MEWTIANIEKEQAWTIRHKVMWPNKSIEYIKLEDDSSGIHLGLFKSGKLISVVSLFIDGEQAQFRKFATTQEEQGKGYGSKLLRYALERAKEEGVCKVWCNARTNKIHFYKKYGLCETGKEFIKGGQSYIIMEKYFA
ncbi:GNAT family N-acetyltransferase [Priestia endophytica]|uniref:GNAT family N-acetyltransferase n=1 Tax=Priestia endophytica TaxID=135735 RepID=UPI000DCA758C|nr:GNAT family N-acetyltransferase [Priestia endophytica]RAS75375.1 GNAT family N-acetyltransferase [Priestia endophytica]